MKIIERYFTFHFAAVFFCCVLSLVFFYLIFDFFSRLNLIVEGTIPLESAARYYLNIVPLIFVSICPISVLISTMYSLSGFSKNNEIIAAAAGGLHPYRIFFPLLAAGLVISALSILVNERFVPEASRTAYEIRYSSGRDPGAIMKNRILYGSANRKFFLKTISPADNSLTNMEITQFCKEGFETIKFQARTGFWKNGTWILEQVTFRQFSDEGTISASLHAPRAEIDSESWMFFEGVITYPGRTEKIFREFQPSLSGIAETPQDFMRYQLKFEEMDFHELKRYVVRLREAGFNPRAETVALHSKISSPLASFVLMLIGISLAVKQKKGGFLVGFGTAIGISLVYYLAAGASGLLGESLLTPAFGAWLPSILFIVPGLVLLTRAKYISS